MENRINRAAVSKIEEFSMTRRTVLPLTFEEAVWFERAAVARGSWLRYAHLLTFACGLLFFSAARAQTGATFDCLIDPSLTLKLGSPVTSILDKVDVDRGDFVKRGQLIAQLESAVEEATVAANEVKAASTAEIESKEAVLELKKTTLARKLGLKNSGVLSAQQDIDQAQAEFNVAQQDVVSAKLNRQMAELELQRSRTTLEQRTIRSPIDGIITKRTLGPGEYVYQEANIVTVARIDPLFVETFLPVSYYGQIKVGDAAHVRPNDPVGGDYQAAVKVVDQVFDAASGTFGVRLELPNPEHIVPGGLRCRITFDVPEKEAKLPSTNVGLGR
jgi:RND family efflux transporter MFP subunit